MTPPSVRRVKRKAEQPQEAGPKYTETMMVNDIVREAQNLGWLVHHDRPAFTQRGWRTALQGDAGFQDLLLLKGGKVAAWECKSAIGKVTPLQQAWLDGWALVPGVDVRVVRPADIESAYKFLVNPKEDV